MNENGRNTMLDGLAAQITHVSLHSAYPGAGGSNEISGGGPAYERSTVFWDPAAGGILSASTQPSFNIPLATSISWCGFWSDGVSAAAGDFYGSVPLGSGAPYVAIGTEGTEMISAINHPFADGQTVTFLDTLGSIPGGITEGQRYWVRDAGTDQFKISATESGAVVDLLTSGAALVYSIVQETYNQQGIHTFTSLDVAVS